MAAPNSIKFTIDRKFLARIFSKIKVSTEHFHKGVPCWEWTAAISRSGYGVLGTKNGTALPSHRVIYEIFVEPVPKQLHCDHLCRVRHCVNPVHIEIVTAKENVLRGVGLTAINAKKEFCKNGHFFSPSNIYIHIRNGSPRRYCRRCRLLAKRRQNAKRKEMMLSK